MSKRKLVMWAGFESGEIYREPFNSVHDGYGNIPSRPVVLFSNKQHACTRFEDVRRVEIREIKRGRMDKVNG